PSVARRGAATAGRQRAQPAGNRGIAGLPAAGFATAAQMARQPQQTADQRDQRPQRGHHRDEQGRQNRRGGLDLPTPPDDFDPARVVGQKTDDRDDRRNQDESDQATHYFAAPSRATSNPST